jgi:succinoglycan biosynthesis transport protein ExoP
MHDDIEELPSIRLEQYWSVARRRRWWLLLPLFLGWAIIWGVSWLLPTTYRSEALILVEQPKVPEQYVVPNVTVNLQDRLQSMTEQILSRTRLQATINRFQLYPKRTGRIMAFNSGDPIEKMRKDIHIDLVESPGHPGELSAFKIFYSAPSRDLAHQVNSDLTSLFIAENLKSQQQQSEDTTAFLAGQLTRARAELDVQDAKIRTFKTKHFGDLPSQLETNVQILTGMQTQLDNNQRAFEAAKQQKQYLESLLFQRTLPEDVDKQLLELRTSLAEARSHYTESFPDVVAIKQKIDQTEKLKAELENEISAKSASNAGVPSVSDSQYDSSTTMMQVRSQFKVNDLEIQNYRRHITETEAQIAIYRERLNMTPATEQELADISREYDEAKSNYNSLLQKQNQSQLATSLEQRQQGQQFRIIDPPSVPDKLSSPDRFRISLMGLAVGAAFGLVLTISMEFADSRIWDERDLEGVVSGLVLVGIPHLTTQAESRWRMALGFLEFATALVIVLAIAVGNFYSFYKG